MKKLVLSLVLAACAVMLTTGCKNTAEGMGRDIERTGEKIQDKVD